MFNSGNYVILRQSRIIEENVDLPEWLDDVVKKLEYGNRPKLYIISQLPLLLARRSNCRDYLVDQRVPTLDEYDAAEFCDQLIGFFDRNPERWRPEDIAKIVRASGGNIGFLVSLTRSISKMDDFEQVEQMIASDSDRMTNSITTYVNWAFKQLANYEEEKRALIFLNSISPCDIVDLSRAIKSERPISKVLGKLLDLGLIEREAEHLYKLNPLLSARLNRNLVNADLVAWFNQAILDFIKSPIEYSTDHDYVKIESKIKATLLSGVEEIPNDVLLYISAAHWFHAGIQLYHARRRMAAYRILEKAYERRDKFAANSRNELVRYFCLSSTRMRNFKQSEECINLLDNVFSTKDMAAFLRADLLEHKGNYVDAIKEYEKTLSLNRGKNSRIERTYRPLISCMLSLRYPDFPKAEKYAAEWRGIRETIFSLSAVARVYLNWKYSPDKDSIPRDVDSKYIVALDFLGLQPGVGSAYFEIKSEEFQLKKDIQKAIEFIDLALRADSRFELRVKRWRLMVRSREGKMVDRALRELDAAKNNLDFKNNWIPFLDSLAEIYASGLRILGRPMASLNSFAPELSSSELTNIIRRLEPIRKPKGNNRK